MCVCLHVCVPVCVCACVPVCVCACVTLIKKPTLWPILTDCSNEVLLILAPRVFEPMAMPGKS